MGMRYVTALVEADDGIKVDQVFFHDPDGYMIELCNCENIPILPLSSCPFKPRGSSFKKAPITKCGFMENAMMESLSMDMLNFSFWFKVQIIIMPNYRAKRESERVKLSSVSFLIGCEISPTRRTFFFFPFLFFKLHYYNMVTPFYYNSLLMGPGLILMRTSLYWFCAICNNGLLYL